MANHDSLQFVKLLQEDERFIRLNQPVIKTNSVIVANQTVQTGRIEFIIPPLSIKLDCSFAIIENDLVKSLAILVTAAVSELTSAWYSF